jgi:hypothetical protein
MKKILLFLTFIASYKCFAQSISITPTKVTANSTTKPIIIPRMTSTAMWNIQNPTKSTLVFDLTNNILRMYDGRNWVKFKSFGTDISPIVPSMNARKENETVANSSQPIPSKQ